MSNFRKYWKEHIFGHLLPAAGAGWLSTSPDWMPVGLGLMTALMIYQWWTYHQFQDTLKKDLRWLIHGFALGIVIGLPWHVIANG